MFNTKLHISVKFQTLLQAFFLIFLFQSGELISTPKSTLKVSTFQVLSFKRFAAKLEAYSVGKRRLLA